jgi:hypothetical protein
MTFSGEVKEGGLSRAHHTTTLQEIRRLDFSLGEHEGEVKA